MKKVGLLALFFFLFLANIFAQNELTVGYQFIFPGPNAKHTHQNTNIILRFKNHDPSDVHNLSSFIKVTGEISGAHSGKTTIASDQQTIIFNPDKNFELAEKVMVNIKPEISGKKIQTLCYGFNVLANEFLKISDSEESNGEIAKIKNAEIAKNADIIKPRILPNGVSVPADFPYLVIKERNNPSHDYLFTNTMVKPYYNIVFNTWGEPVWYQKTNSITGDFRVQSNDWITMQNGEDFKDHEMGYVAYTQNFEYIKTFKASNGYSTDEHEFYMLPDSGYLLIGKRETLVDMSQYVEGGDAEATVKETCIQEFTANGEMIFIWRAWDHFDIADTELTDLTSSYISFPHMNAIYIDYDNHILLSSRHLSEISKIHRKTGEFIWRLSGTPGSTNTDFQFVNDPLNGFRNQHAIRSLGNNRYTLLDNGNLHEPPISRAVEYVIDTVNMTAEMVWEYRPELDGRIARFRGNAQRLSNSNTHINWEVNNHPHIALEITPEGETALDMRFENKANCYRSFRHPWEGECIVPYLLLEPQPDNLTLLFNKFGDDNVEFYNIYGSTSPNPTTLIDTSRSTLKKLDRLDNDLRYYFRVTAVDKSGLESDYSNEESIYLNLTVPGNNLIRNGDFSNNFYGWNEKIDNLATAKIQIDDGVCNIAVQHGSKNYNSVQLYQDSILLIKGQEYIFEFESWSDKSGVMELKFTENNSHLSDYSRIGYIALSSAKKQYTYSFVMQESTDNNASLQINAGKTERTIFIDNISLKINPESATVAGIKDNNKFLLLQNFPNPFIHSTSISYTIPKRCRVTLEVLDTNGRIVEMLVNKLQLPGRYKTVFNAAGLTTGVYYYRIIAGGYIATNKMLLIR